MQKSTACVPFSPHERWLIGGVIFVVAIAHIASFAYLSSLSARNPEAPPYPIVAGDSEQYAQLADNLIANHSYGVSSDPASTRHWPPGYTAFLAGIKWATGSFTPAIVIQSVLGLLAIFLIYAIARGFVPSGYAACAALLYGLDPMVIFSDTTIISDGLFAALLVIIVYVAFFQSRLHGIVRWALLGLLLGAAVMVRAVGEFLIVLVPAAFLLREWLRLPREREETYILPALAVYVLCAAIIIVPWIARNHEMFGNYEIAQGGADDLLYYDVTFFLQWKELGGSLASVLYPAHHADTPQFAAVDAEIQQTLSNTTPQGGDPENYTEKVALHYIFQDPIRYAYFDVANTLPFFLSGSFGAYDEIVHQERNNTDLSASTLNSAEAVLKNVLHGDFSKSAAATLASVLVEVLYWLLVCVFALAGLILEWRRFEMWIFAGLVAYFALLTAALSIARYRVPAEPYLLLLSAVGVYTVVTRIRRRLVFERASVKL